MKIIMLIICLFAFSYDQECSKEAEKIAENYKTDINSYCLSNSGYDTDCVSDHQQKVNQIIADYYAVCKDFSIVKK